jgi:hypothetical protein
MTCPEKRLYIAIIKQAIKDFYTGCHSMSIEAQREKEIVKEWVVTENGSFSLCSLAWSDNPTILKEKLLITFERIENGGKLKR